MNERIKELAEQAGAEFYKGFAGSPDSVKFMQEDFKKFAESIVRECAIYAFSNDQDYYAMLNHFGVKE